MAMLTRSVHVGRSRYSRRCYLFGDLRFCSCRVEPWPGDSRSHRNSAWAFVFPLLGTILTLVLRLFYAAAATLTRLLLCNGSYTFSAHPEMM